MKHSTAARAATATVATIAVALPLSHIANAETTAGGRAPAVGETGFSIIHGQVVNGDKGNKPLDDVKVTAFRTTKNTTKFPGGEM